MTEARAQSELSKDVFDRLLGRKGDAVRLDPAINVIVKFLGTRFDAILRGARFDATAEVGEHKQTTAAAVMKKHKGGALCIVLGAKANAPSAYMICDYPAVSVISELMLGGDPEFAALLASRAPTSVECDLVRQFADLVGKALQTTLSTPDCPHAIRVAERAEEIRDGEDDDSVIAFDITLAFGEAKPILSLAVTHNLLLQMARPVQETVRKPQDRPAAPPNRNALTVKVPVTGSIQLPPISLGELAMLGIGDMLPLSAEPEANVKLKVKGRPLYNCSLGRKGANYAICLQRPHEAMNEALSGIGLPIPETDPEEAYDE